MNIDIRKSIINNFKDSSEDEIKKSIDESIKDSNELALPGLGVLFEVLWKNSDDKFRKEITDKIKRNLMIS